MTIDAIMKYKPDSICPYPLPPLLNIHYTPNPPPPACTNSKYIALSILPTIMHLRMTTAVAQLN